ncbi:ankyrin repeat domain-containing protein [Alteromonadaceae bacterium M269]|nr:ankyrin repeat domain-containing protein [Alteromonadaceae bacterium M269]
MRRISIILCFFVLSLGCSGSDTLGAIYELRAKDIYTNPSELQLALAAGKGDSEKVATLIQNGVNPNSQGKMGLPILFWPIRTGNIEGFKLLLEAGADPDVKWDTGSSVTHWSVELSDSRYLELSLRHGGNIDSINPSSGDTLIFNAMNPQGRVNLNVILANAPNLDAQNKKGNTPMLVAASLNQFDIVYKLLELGADYKIRNQWEVSVLDRLKERKLDVNSSNYKWQQKSLKKIQELELEMKSE